jgi:hypothetical protein
VKGLGSFGVLAVRPLVVALAEKDSLVVQEAQKALESISFDQIEEYFKGKRNELQSLQLIVERILEDSFLTSPGM